MSDDERGPGNRKSTRNGSGQFVPVGQEGATETERALLRSLQDLYGSLNKHLDAISNAYKGALEMQRAQMEAQAEVNRKLWETVHGQPLRPELTEEEKESLRARTLAWVKLSDKLPDVLEIAMAAIASKVVGK